jgi:hypothetical protein
MPSSRLAGGHRGLLANAWIGPAARRRYEFGLLRALGIRSVGIYRRLSFQNWINDTPCFLHIVFPREESCVSFHRRSQQAFVSTLARARMTTISRASSDTPSTGASSSPLSTSRRDNEFGLSRDHPIQSETRALLEESPICQKADPGVVCAEVTLFKAPSFCNKYGSDFR